MSLSRFINGGRTTLPRVIALDWLEKDDRDPSFFQLSDGTVLQEQPDLAKRRAEQVVELLKGAGLTAPKYSVRWVDASPVPNGTDDHRNRRVDITLQP